MFLSISTQYQPASDLGFLFHKHPDRVHKIALPFGKATFFFSELSDARSTAVLQFEVDSIGLVRGWGGGGNSHGDLYVNDRPYVTSSLFSLAISKVLRSAMNGISKERPELVQASLPFEVYIPTLSSPRGRTAIMEYFEPLGYQLQITEALLDSKFPEWGNGCHFQVRLTNRLPLELLLKHLYVLLPVLDGTKHYWVHQDEISKLIDKGKSWLSSHPHKKRIINRYLKNQKNLTKEALAVLADGNEESVLALPEEKISPSLHELRLNRVVEVLKESGARRVIDLGCGPGALVKMLLKDSQFTKIVGVDVSLNELKKAKLRLEWDDLSEHQKNRVSLLQGSLVYSDQRFKNFDAAALVEVIEHVDIERLPALERVLFECARPGLVVVTTPNRDYNDSIQALAIEGLRHRDHRFEWTEAEFKGWAMRVAEKYGYSVRFERVGNENPDGTAPTQMGVFEK